MPDTHQGISASPPQRLAELRQQLDEVPSEILEMSLRDLCQLAEAAMAVGRLPAWLPAAGDAANHVAQLILAAVYWTGRQKPASLQSSSPP